MYLKLTHYSKIDLHFIIELKFCDKIIIQKYKFLDMKSRVFLKSLRVTISIEILYLRSLKGGF